MSLALEIAPGIALHTIRYEIVGPDFSRAGTVLVENSNRFTFQVGGVPEGDGYEVTLSAVDETEETTCEGAERFAVQAGETTRVPVLLVCRTGGDTGSVIIDGTTNVCPVIQEMTVYPTEAVVGQRIALSASVLDKDQMQDDVTYKWTATLGDVDDAMSPEATFRCADVGKAKVTLAVSDGLCSERLSARVNCLSAPDAGVEAGVSEPGQDGGEVELPPEAGALDAGSLEEVDGAVAASDSGKDGVLDAGAVPREPDADISPHRPDAESEPPGSDADAEPHEADAGTDPQEADAGMEPHEPDAGAQPQEQEPDAGDGDQLAPGSGYFTQRARGYSTAGSRASAWPVSNRIAHTLPSAVMSEVQ